MESFSIQIFPLIGQRWILLKQCLFNAKCTGTNGRINLDQTDRGIHHILRKKLKHINPYYIFEESIHDQIQYSGYRVDSVISFLNNITNNKDYASFSEGVISSAVIEAAEQSAN